MRLRVGLCMLGAMFVAIGAACGIDAVGTKATEDVDDGSASMSPEAGSDGGPSTNTGDADSAVPGESDAAFDASACPASGTTCTTSLEAGWTPLAFATNRSATCPAGFAAVDLVTSPSANAACTCGCQIAANDPPTCASGSFAGLVGSSAGACVSGGVTYNVTNGTGCSSLGGTYTLAAYAKYAPLPLDRGTCNSSAVKDATKVTSTAVRACVPPSTCAEDVCLGTPSAKESYASCIVHDGDVACPAGPFANKTTAGTSANVTCGGCATCENNATCGPAVLHLFNDSLCATEVASRAVNDVCNPVASGSAGVSNSYFKYVVATNNPSCAPTSSPTAVAGLDQQRTICCR